MRRELQRYLMGFLRMTGQGEGITERARGHRQIPGYL